MLEKEHIENFLRLNGILCTAPDEEIHGALLAARWHEDDVAAALVVLRGGEKSKEVSPETKRMASARQLFRSDNHLAPETLASLLGVEIKLHGNVLSAVDVQEELQKGKVSIYVTVILASLVMLCGAVLSAHFFAEGQFGNLIARITDMLR